MIAPVAPRIHKLSLHLVNQIAAGEVIERPASVVKELVENAIDAGAVHVDVRLEEGGKRLIRVLDDGGGIVREDLPLALASHATSKLASEGDLAIIRTLGFRGEALASIASVSELDILSRPVGSEVGARIVARHGEMAERRPEAMAPGTRVSVRNLFENVPARRRFLKGDRTELAKITTTLQHLALAVPNVGFVVTHEDRTVFRYTSGQSAEQRLYEVLGEERARRLLPLPDQDVLRGWIGRPDDGRRRTNALNLFLNGRWIRDRVVLHAVKEAYRGFQIPGMHPVAILFLNIDPADVDVNVHPTKLEVRFRDSRRIHSLVYGSVRQLLERSRTVPTPWGASPTPPEMAPYPVASTSMLDGRCAEGPGERPPAPPPQITAKAVNQARVPAGGLFAEDKEHRVFQVRNSYLVIEEEEGLRIIDQHALHEKVLYEEISAAYRRGELRQLLLVPETVELEAKEWEVFTQVQPSLSELGFEIEEFGGRTLLVRAVPVGLEREALGDVLRDLLASLQGAWERGRSAPHDERTHRLLATLACKRAVKAGQPLHPEAQLDLVRGRALAFQPQNCPHGRPSELFITWRELDRRFRRR